MTFEAHGFEKALRHIRFAPSRGGILIMKLRPLFSAWALLQAVFSLACVHSDVLRVNVPATGYFAQYPAPGCDMIAYAVPTDAAGTSQTLIVMPVWLRGDVVRLNTVSTCAWLKPVWLRLGSQRFLVVEDHPASRESQVTIYAIDKYGSRITARGLYQTPRQPGTEYVFAHWNPRERTLLLRKSEAFGEDWRYSAKSNIALELDPGRARVLHEVSVDKMKCTEWYRISNYIWWW